MLPPEIHGARYLELGISDNDEIVRNSLAEHGWNGDNYGMSVKSEKSDDAYIVPFGREEGSFLNVLKLPPDAAAHEVAKHAREFRGQAQSDNKKKQRELHEKLKKKEITQEEHDAGVQQGADEMNRKLQEFTALKQKYDSSVADQRKLGSKGLKDERQIWMNIYAALTGEAKEFWKWLAPRRPLGMLPGDLLAAIEQRWITSGAPLFLVSDAGFGQQALAAVCAIAARPPAHAKACEARFRQDMDQKLKNSLDKAQARRKKGEVTDEECKVECDRARQGCSDETQIFERLITELRAFFDERSGRKDSRLRG